MSKYRVIVIDDDDDARKMLAMVLQPRYEVVEACDGLDALSKLETHEPDFAIIDIMMPVMDGYQVCEAIRRHPRFSSMQVMFLSAFGTRENIQRSYAVGGNLFLTKPVDPSRILKNLDLTIEHEPPPIQRKRYTIQELKALDILHADAEKARSRPQPAPAFTRPAPERPAPRPAARPAVAQPYTPPRAEPTPLRPRDAEQASQRARLLAVDDDPELLRMMDLALRDYFEVTRASNGIDAIERMVDYEPDLVVLDIMMPRMNGYQLLQSIRRNMVFHDLPVVVLSAKSSDRDRDYAARLGANQFLAKPYRMEDLIEVLLGITRAAEFRVRPKKLSMLEIKERLFAEDKERKEREHAAIRQQKFAEMKSVFQEAEASEPEQHWED